MPKLVHVPAGLKINAGLTLEAGYIARAVNTDIASDVNTDKLAQVCELASSRADKSLFNLDIDDFDGPIDLLLHLVKRNELPIEKLSLAKVADQFLSCVKQAELFDLEIAGEYLVIAANLLSIKASLLVDPKSAIEIESEEGPDPHAELLQRLRDAAVYQQAAESIASRNMLGIDVFSSAFKFIPDKTAAVAEEPLAKHDLSLLLKAWNRVLKKMPVQKPQMVINWARVSVTEKMKVFVDRLNAAPQKRFLFEELADTLEDLSHLVSSFVAILELCKRQIVFIAQDSFQENIYITLRDENSANTLSSQESMERSEFDINPAETAEEASQIVGNV